MTLRIDVFTGAGLVLAESGLDRVVVRRREVAHEPGSEIAICPQHCPLLMQTQACTMRLTRGGVTHSVAVEAGILEVVDDHLTLVVS